MVTREQKIQALKNAVEKFNYESMHSIMEFINHKWAIAYGEFRVPTVDEIKDTARFLMLQIIIHHIDEEVCYSSCGGVELSFKYYNDVFEAFIKYVPIYAIENTFGILS